MLQKLNTKSQHEPGYIELKNITHAYDTKKILDDISFSMKDGEIICLLGASGSGKSTLLRLIAGVEALISGSIKINGNIIVDKTTFIPPERRNIGMVFQDYALFPHLTIIKNIMFGNNRNGKITREQAMTQLEYIDLVAYADDYPNMISGGQQQRVALARTLATEPDILLLDEPFSGLDSKLREELRVETKKLIKTKNISAIFVTHDAEEALYLADRIILLNDSKIEQIDSPKNMLKAPSSIFAAQYLRRYNIVEVSVKDDIVVSPFGSFNIKNLCCCRHTKLKSNHKIAHMLIAENDIHLETHDAPDKFDHQMDVKVLQINHYSEFSELQLSVEGLNQPLTLRTSLREKDVMIGDVYQAHFNYKNILIFSGDQ